MSAEAVRAALGCEVIDVTDELKLQRLLREAHDESAALAGLEGSLECLRRARATQTALVGLPAEQRWEALRLRRTALAGGRPRRSRPVATFSGYTEPPDDEKGHLGLLQDGL